MKKIIRTVGTITAMGLMLVSAYWLGTTQAKTVTEVQTVTEIKEVEKLVENVPNRYLDTIPENYVDMQMVVGFSVNDDGLQLYFEDGTGYYWER